MRHQLSLIQAQVLSASIQAGVKWQEDLHPRANDGKFGSGGSSLAEGGSSSDGESPSKNVPVAAKPFLEKILQKPHPKEAAQRMLEYAKEHPGQVAAGAIIAAVSLVGVSQLGRRLIRDAVKAEKEPAEKVAMHIASPEEIPSAVKSAYSKFGSDADMSDGLKVALFNLEEKIQAKAYEEVHAFDEAGEAIFKVNGTAKEVEISSFQSITAQNHPTGLLMTHNHPPIKLPDGSKVTSSFSPADIQTAFNLKLKELRAVTNEHIYILTPGKGKSRFQDLTSKEASKIEDIIGFNKDKSRSKYLQGLISIAQAEHECFHNAWEQVAKEMPHVLSYQKITK